MGRSGQGRLRSDGWGGHVSRSTTGVAGDSSGMGGGLVVSRARDVIPRKGGMLALCERYSYSTPRVFNRIAVASRLRALLSSRLLGNRPAQWRRFTGEGEGARLPTCTTVSTARARGASEAKRRSKRQSSSSARIDDPWRRSVVRYLSLCRFDCFVRAIPICSLFTCSICSRIHGLQAEGLSGRQCKEIIPLDSCNGLLLCRCLQFDGVSKFHYAVCNPATEEWVMLPDANWADGENRIACLCFDPAISSHFHVVEYVEDEAERVTGVEIYSSKTGLWSLHGNGWNGVVLVSLSVNRRSVFLNGFLHSVTPADEIVAVDMEGKKWRKIPVPDRDNDIGIIHQTQGCLCAFNVDLLDIFKLSIWFLEDYDTNNWILKHTVSSLDLFEGKNYRLDFEYQVIAVHPECNLIFFVYGLDNTLMAYEMDRKEVRVIRNLGHDYCWPYLPYVPLFSELLTDGR
ncbi:uncharacterized protein LOC127780280 [Oryza glaberrima]|uniref:uncharacterized protein LOC127780280 n=1 Tax=Oryza glaberrima TaxID=4538 RepID=UPI00224C50BA|nr:uncharacterized protein LOC127780280 [Oryza glaberrima]